MDNFHGKMSLPSLNQYQHLPLLLSPCTPLATLPSSPFSTLIYDPLNSYLTPISMLIFFSFFSLPGVDLNRQPPDSEFTSLSTTPRVLELDIALLFLCIITFFGPRPTSAKVIIYAKPKNFVLKFSTGDSQNEKHTEFKNFNTKIVTKYL